MVRLMLTSALLAALTVSCSKAPEQKEIIDKGGTMRLGAYPAVLKDSSLTHSLYNALEVSERHRHRYEVNPDYHQALTNRSDQVER